MKNTFLYLLLLLLTSCEKQIDRPINADNLNLIVVDGIITNEHKSHTIRITRSVTSLNALPQPVSGASVILSDPDQAIFLSEQTNHPGVYQTPADFFAKPNTEYSLLISVDGKPYSAKSHQVDNEPLKMLRYEFNSNKNLYRIVWVDNPYNAAHPAMYEISLDWSQVPGYTNLPPENCKAKLYYYTLPTLDVSQIFSPEMQQIFFPSGTRITERKYSLNPEYTEFIRALISETNWKGGLFDSAPANVPTNMSEGAVGFFAACNVISDSLIVQ